MDKVKLRISMIDVDVVVKTATDDGKDKDTDLKTVCTGKPGLAEHAPVKVNGLMRCSNSSCGREEKSYHPFPRGRDNGDGTFTIPKAEDLEAAKVDRELVETITVTASPTEQVEAQTLPSGRFYWLKPDKTAGKKYDAARRHIASHPERTYLTYYARSSSPSTYRVLVHGDLLALQELATPDQLKDRPAAEVPEASDKEVLMMDMIAEDLLADFDQARFVDTRKAVIAAALAKANPTAAGEDSENPLATVTPLPTVDDDFAKALRALGKDPDAVLDKPATKKQKGKVDPAEAPPAQPLPSEVPANVDTTLAKPKRAPRKTAAPTKKTA